MTDFARALPIILKSEGGYVNDPADAGGETNRGVTFRVWRQWCDETGTAPKPMEDLTAADVAPLYEARYWRKGRCHEIPWPLALLHFDACVNMGVTQATKLLQRALGVKDDGILGPVTLRYAREAQASECYRYLLERTFFYRALARKNLTQTKFLVGGWLGRLATLYAEVK